MSSYTFQLAGGNVAFTADGSKLVIADRVRWRSLRFCFVLLVLFLLIPYLVVFGLGFYALLQAWILDGFSWWIPLLLAGAGMGIGLGLFAGYHLQASFFGFGFTITDHAITGHWGLIPIRVAFSRPPTLQLTVSKPWRGGWEVGGILITDANIFHRIPLFPSTPAGDAADRKKVKVELEQTKTFLAKHCPYLTPELNLNATIREDDGPASRKPLIHVFIVCMLFCLIGGGILFFEVIHPVYKHFQSGRWMPVECTIVASDIEQEISGRGHSVYRLNVRYRYTIDGREYLGTQYNFFHNREDQYRIHELWSRVPVDKRTRGLVNPRDYQEAVLDPEITKLKTSWLLMVPLLILSIGIAGLIHLGRSLCRRNGNATAPQRNLS